MCLSGSDVQASLCLRMRGDFKPRGEGRIVGTLSDPWRIWTFLTTHGMWYQGIKSKKMDLSIDLLTGGTTLLISHEKDDYRLIKAIESIPLFHLAVDALVTTKEEGEYTSWGIHSKIKNGEIKAVNCRKILEVTPLTFHAATSGIHRVGLYYRIMAFQQSLSRRIAQALSLHGDIPPPYEVFSVKEEQEICGSLAALLSGIMKWGRVDIRVIREELTTSVIEPPNEEVLKGVKKLLRNLGEDILPDIIWDRDKGPLLSFNIFSNIKDIQLEKSLKYINRISLGRLACYDGLAEKFVEEEFDLAIDFSEQMGSCDVYLFLLILEERGILEKCRKMWLIGTPLTYPAAMYSLLYLKQIQKLPSSRLVLSSEDPAFSKIVAERISSEGEKIIYIAAGPVSHVLSFYKTLLEKKGKENVRTIPLSPHK